VIATRRAPAESSSSAGRRSWALNHSRPTRQHVRRRQRPSTRPNGNPGPTAEAPPPGRPQPTRGTVTANDANNPPGTAVTDNNPANYFGAAPGINIVKFVNGFDADSAPGPHVAVGSTVTFTYVVTNTGNVPLANVAVSDDKLGLITSFTGDTNGNGLLDLTETWTYTATATALAGQQTNVGTVTGQDANNPPGTTVTANPTNTLATL
jgi:hypothetical protein